VTLQSCSQKQQDTVLLYMTRTMSMSFVTKAAGCKYYVYAVYNLLCIKLV